MKRTCDHCNSEDLRFAKVVEEDGAKGYVCRDCFKYSYFKE